MIDHHLTTLAVWAMDSEKNIQNYFDKHLANKDSQEVQIRSEGKILGILKRDSAGTISFYATPMDTETQASKVECRWETLRDILIAEYIHKEYYPNTPIDKDEKTRNAIALAPTLKQLMEIVSK